ncbi:MAG: hypothetical protein ACQEP2_02045 [Actinomycetota bacterium]
MSVVNISLPETFLQKIEKYRKVKGENRSDFFKKAAELYFNEIEKEMFFKKRKKAIEKLMEIGYKERKKGTFKGIDFVKEIRKMREERTNELLGRI